MKVMSATVAFVAAAGMVAFGQATQQNPTTTQQPTTERPATRDAQPTPRTQGTTAAGQQVTISGCIVREADFRRTQDAGRGGVAGTGVGQGNEFVLANAMMGTGAAAGGAVGTAGAGAAGASATAGGTTMAFELTGSGEGQAAEHVGRRVEVTGMLKAATGGGPTANAPLSNDLELRELDVTSVRASASGTCAPAQP
jgi:hypothetical protein